MSRRAQLRAVVLSALLVVSSLSVAGAGTALADTGGNAGDVSTFKVTQGDECYEVTPYGNSSKRVEEFYDYRSNETNETGWWTNETGQWSSYGTTHLQENQNSSLFIYDGEKGYSLVLLHDKFRDGPHASTITMNFSGMPQDGEWVVRDDNYNNDSQDDNWDTSDSTHEIDWKWAADRNDGGAFLGIGGEEITIDPAFNEDANAWGDWPYSNDTANRTENWKLLDGGDEPAQQLDKNSSVTVEQGSCPDETAPNASFTVSSDTVANNEEVTFNASASTDNEGIESYEWELGDGTTDTGEVVTHAYNETGEYNVTLTVSDAANNTDSVTKTVTVEEPDTIEYVNASAVRIRGDFANVTAKSTYYETDGVGTDTYHFGPVEGTTVVAVPDDGEWGPVVSSVSVYESDGQQEPNASKANPDFEAQLDEVRPDAVSTFVENVTEVDNGTYEVTFGYRNPNDANMSAASSEFVNGTTNDTPPATFEPGRNTVTVTWTPESDNESLVWETDFGNFDHGVSETATPTAGQIDSDSEAPNASIDAPETATAGEEVTFDGSGSSDDTGVTSYHWEFGDGATASGETVTHAFDEPGEYNVTLTVSDAVGNTDTAMQLVTVEEQSTQPPADDGPTADLTLSKQTADFGDKVGFDASGSSDDDGIVEYRWDLQGDGDIDRKTDGKNSTVWHKVYANFDEPGTYHPEVTVVDTDGNTDTASAKLVVERNDDTKPSATLKVPKTVEVGAEATLKATHLTGVESGVKHICWVVEHNHDKPDGKVATHVFDSTGEKNVTLHIVDKAGNSNMLTTTVEVVESSSDGGDGGDGSDGNDGDKNQDPPEKGLDDDDDDGSNSGGMPSAGPSGGSDNNNDDGGDDEPNEAAFEGSTGGVSDVVLDSEAADTTVEMFENAPEDVRSPTAERDGFAALSYLDVSGAGDASATFAVSKDRLDEVDAAADQVTLFRFEDGAWTAVETERVEETDDTYRFSANASEGVYAVGVDRAATAVDELRVSDDRVAPGEDATVVATVSNDGRADGVHEVELTVDGETVATERVSVAAGETAQVEFTRNFDSPGVYAVSAGDADAEIVVEGIETTETSSDGDDTATTEPSETSDDGADVPGFGMGVALVALLAAALLARLRS